MQRMSIVGAIQPEGADVDVDAAEQARPSAAGAAQPRVSVIVATYNTGPELHRVFDSMDAQTLPADTIELVVVDDGSTDDTYEQVQRFAADRSYVVTHRIPNSGWPGRPRNIGTDMARGTYVLYMDHDDELFPEALERLYATAQAYEADVVMGKEIVSGWNAPGWSTWRLPTGRIELDALAVQCITPHKLYRRSFLLEKDIRYPEGRVRLEDFDFNAKAWVRTDAIAVMSDYPVYNWIIHDANSHKGGYDWDVYWRSFSESLRPIEEELAPGPKQDTLLVRWYRSRILERLGPQFIERSDTYKKNLMTVVGGLIDRFPPRLDPQLAFVDRARSALLRAGDVDGLVELAALDRDLRCRTEEVGVQWRDGQCVVTFAGRIGTPDGRLLAVATPDGPEGTAVRLVGESLSRRLPPETLDLGETLRDAVVEIVIRSRATNVDWIVPTEAEVTTVAGSDGALAVGFRGTAVIDPRTAAAGRPLDDDVWDVYVRVDGPGLTPTSRLSALDVDGRAALVGNQAAVVYRTKPGFLAIDLGSKVRTVIGSARPRAEDAEIIERGGWLRNAPVVGGALRKRTAGRTFRLRVPLSGLPVSGEAYLRGELQFDDLTAPAVLRTEGSTAVLEQTGDVRLPTGRYAVRAKFADRRSAQLFWCDVTLDGEIRVLPNKH